jgi:hypothetical protein
MSLIKDQKLKEWWWDSKNMWKITPAPAYTRGWEDCKEEVLKILQQDWTGADLSINSCDQHYIDEIKKL